MRKLIGALLAMTALVPALAQAQDDRRGHRSGSEARAAVRVGGGGDMARSERPGRGEGRPPRAERGPRGEGFGGGPRAGVDAPDRRRPPGWGDDLRGLSARARGVVGGGEAWRGDRQPDGRTADRGWRGGARPDGDRAGRPDLPRERGDGWRDRRHDLAGDNRRDRRDDRGDGRRDDRRDRSGRGGIGLGAGVGLGGGWNGGFRDRSDWSGNDWDRSRFNRDARSGWNRDWRRDARYDWNRYRGIDRGAYRLPRYYAPYGWNGGYRRFNVGIGLNAALWGSNYWIDDPFAYRLPEAWGPYRWVRYYDDALLVDLRSGVVIDAVYGIFW